MTALSGGDKLENKPSPKSSVLERPNTAAGEMPSGVRSLDRIFLCRPTPRAGARWRKHGSPSAARWRARCARSSTRAARRPRSPMRSASLCTTTFRTRGVTLTSFELRRLVVEVLDLQQHAGSRRAGRGVRWSCSRLNRRQRTPWTGDEPAAPAPTSHRPLSRRRRRRWSTCRPETRSLRQTAGDSGGRRAARLAAGRLSGDRGRRAARSRRSWARPFRASRHCRSRRASGWSCWR